MLNSKKEEIAGSGGGLAKEISALVWPTILPFLAFSRPNGTGFNNSGPAKLKKTLNNRSSMLNFAGEEPANMWKC